MNARSNGPSRLFSVSIAGPTLISIWSRCGEASMWRRAMATWSSLMSHVTIRPPGGSASAMDSAE